MKGFLLMSVLALMTGCASSVSREVSPGVSTSVQKIATRALEGGKGPPTYQECRQMRQVYVCANGVDGQRCGCVDENRVFGESYSLFGPE